MVAFEDLHPSAIWKYFYEISKIPRPSSKEKKIIDYLISFGKKFDLVTKVDEWGNILIEKPAAKGFEKRKKVCLQSHLDMVAEKDNTSRHDFETDPIEVYIEDGWVKARGTTLGADNGIGIAAQLAILSDKEAKHGPLECLFTVEEEVGLKGAGKLNPDFLTSEILINLDSEDEGELFIGCAGGIDTVGVLSYKSKVVPAGSKAFKISLTGLKGGHSGDDINKDRANSIKLLNRFLWTLSKKIKLSVSILEGGNLRNAIPREAYAIFTIGAEAEQMLKLEFKNFYASLKEELSTKEPDIKLSLENTQLPAFILKRKHQERLLNTIYGCPNGVITMSRALDNLVETSTNLASVKFTGNNVITISTSQRSSVESSKTEIANSIKSILELAKAKVNQSDGYPGWNPDTDSYILDISKNIYLNLFKQEPKIKAIHAGLECGMFKKIYPQLDMISFGPTIRDAHSPNEKMEIASVKKFWDFLLNILEKV